MGKPVPDNYKGKRMLNRAEDLDTFWAYNGKTDSKGNSQLVLFDNVQFIYELSFAKLELEAFGVEYQVTNGLRKFELLKAEHLETLRKREEKE